LIVLPDVRNNNGGWTSGVQIQNLDGATANVVVKINGAQTWSGSIGAYQSVTLYPLPGAGSGFRGQRRSNAPTNGASRRSSMTWALARVI
jgi:hypothetical protein